MIDPDFESVTMTIPAHDSAHPRVRHVEAMRPLVWLALGWRDFLYSLAPSALHGLLVTIGGFAILAVTLHFWLLLPGAFSGFVIVGPILATGLYEMSRIRALGREPTLGDALAAWQRGTRPLVCLGLMLLAAATAWVVASALLFKLFAHVLRTVSTSVIVGLSALDLLVELLLTGLYKAAALGAQVYSMLRHAASWAGITVAAGAEFTAQILRRIVGAMLSRLQQIAMLSLTAVTHELLPLPLLVAGGWQLAQGLPL